MARRGDQLREHILWSAKDVFLEMGFERASMDAVAAKAETSKRSLYAHFENKEALFLAVAELIRQLFLDRLKKPSEYAKEPEQALTLFCGRYLEVLLYESSIRMVRLALAEAERFPEASARYFDALFNEVQAHVAGYLKTTFALTPRASQDAATRLMGLVLHPRLVRSLFGLDKLLPKFDDAALSPDFDLKQVRKAVSEVRASLG